MSVGKSTSTELKSKEILLRTEIDYSYIDIEDLNLIQALKADFEQEPQKEELLTSIKASYTLSWLKRHSHLSTNKTKMAFEMPGQERLKLNPLIEWDSKSNLLLLPYSYLAFSSLTSIGS